MCRFAHPLWRIAARLISPLDPHPLLFSLVGRNFPAILAKKLDRRIIQTVVALKVQSGMSESAVIVAVGGVNTQVHVGRFSMRYVNRSVALVAVLAIATLLGIPSAFAQRDAGSKIRGEYNFYGGSASRSMRGARETSQAYRQYVQTAPQQKVNQEVAKEAADAIGSYITKAQAHMAWMRKQAETGKDKPTLTSLDSIDKNLAAAKKHHESLCEYCEKENVDAKGSMDCCQEIDDSLAAAIAEHDKLMKRLAGNKPVAK